jgi:hypothetical protein
MLEEREREGVGGEGERGSWRRGREREREGVGGEHDLKYTS